MKVLHISTFDHGGAGIAAIRLHKALLHEGVDSGFLTMYGTRNDVPAYYKEPIGAAPLAYRALNRLGLPVTPNQRYWKKINKLGGQYELVTLPFHDHDMSNHPKVREADVINLHFISFFIDIPSFFLKVNKPIVWTMHDMYPFLGCFHYMQDQKKNIRVFGEVEKELMEAKRKAYHSRDKLVMVSPSRSLMALSAASPIMQGITHRHIHNCVDTMIFKPGDKAELRRKFKLPADGLIFLFVSENLDNLRKGFDLLVNALSDMEEVNYTLISVGKPSEHFSDFTHYRSMGPVHDEHMMAELYALADAFILPSREDNLPNTMVESLCCGTPVIAFRTGGMADEIKPGINGLLAENIDPASLNSVIREFLAQPDIFDRQEISKQAHTNFSMQGQAGKYIDLYKEVMT